VGQKPDLEKARFGRKAVHDAAWSGLSIREFCRQRKLHESQFYWWQRNLTAKPAPAPKKPAAIKVYLCTARFTLPMGTRRSARTCRESRQSGSLIYGTDSFHQHNSLDGLSTFLYTEPTVCRLNLVSTSHGTRIPSITR
jgi:hypothetical protein